MKGEPCAWGRREGGGGRFKETQVGGDSEIKFRRRDRFLGSKEGARSRKKGKGASLSHEGREGGEVERKDLSGAERKGWSSIS